MAERSLELIREFLNRNSARLRSNAIAALVALETDDAAGLIVARAFDDPERVVNERAIAALGELDHALLDRTVAPELHRRLTQPEHRAAAWAILGRLRQEGYVPESPLPLTTRLWAALSASNLPNPEATRPWIRRDLVAPSIYASLLGVALFLVYLRVTLGLGLDSPHTYALLSVPLLAPILALTGSRRSLAIGWHPERLGGLAAELVRVGIWSPVGGLVAFLVVSMVYLASDFDSVPGGLFAILAGALICAFGVLAIRLGTLLAADGSRFTHRRVLLQTLAGWAAGTAFFTWIFRAYTGWSSGWEDSEPIVDLLAFCWSLAMPLGLGIAVVFALIDREGPVPRATSRASLVASLILIAVVAAPIVETFRRGATKPWTGGILAAELPAAEAGKLRHGQFDVERLPWVIALDADFRQDLRIWRAFEVAGIDIEPRLWQRQNGSWTEVEVYEMPSDPPGQVVLRPEEPPEDVAPYPPEGALDVSNLPTLCLPAPRAAGTSGELDSGELRLALVVSSETARLEALYENLRALWRHNGTVVVRANALGYGPPGEAPPDVTPPRYEHLRAVYALKEKDPKFRQRIQVDFPQSLFVRSVSPDCRPLDKFPQFELRFEETGPPAPETTAERRGSEKDPGLLVDDVREELLFDFDTAAAYDLTLHEGSEIGPDPLSRDSSESLPARPTESASMPLLLDVAFNYQQAPKRPLARRDFRIEDRIWKVRLEASNEVNDVELELCSKDDFVDSADDPEILNEILGPGQYSALVWPYGDSDGCSSEEAFRPSGETVVLAEPEFLDPEALFRRDSLVLGRTSIVTAEVVAPPQDVVLVLCQNLEAMQEWDGNGTSPVTERMNLELSAGQYWLEVWRYNIELKQYHCKAGYDGESDEPIDLQVRATPLPSEPAS